MGRRECDLRARHQPDAVSYVCQQFTLGPTEVQISWFIGRVHASVNSKFVMFAHRRFAPNYIN